MNATHVTNEGVEKSYKNLVDELRHKLDSYIGKSIAVDLKDYYYILDPSKRVSSNLKGYTSNLLNAFGWFAASKSEKITTSLLYENTCSSNVLPHNLYLPSEEGCVELKRLLIECNENADIFLVGERGSGKTLAQNQFLNFHLETINLLGFTFFRADVGKLHDFNHMETKLDKHFNRMTIQEYMALHAFDVVLSHGAVTTIDPGLLRFQNDYIAARNKSMTTLQARIDFTEFSYYLKQQTDGDNIAQAWREIVIAFAKKDDDKEEKNADLFSFLKNCRRESKLTKDIILILFNYFMRFITTEQEISASIATNEKTTTLKPCKIILMIDGVDNLRTDDYKSNSNWVGGRTSGEWYQFYLDDVKSLLNKGGLASLAHKTLYALRPDTHEQLRDAINATLVHQTGETKEASILYVVPPCAEKMFERKRVAAKEHPGATKFTHKLNQDILKTDDYKLAVTELHKCFEDFIPKFFKAHLSSLKQCETSASTYDDVLELVFNNNMRSLERNAIRTFGAVYEYMQSTIASGSTNKIIRIDAFNNINENVIFEFSVTGGNPYFIPNSNEAANGRWCPNLFEFLDITSSTRWDGLVLLRVLQALPEYSSEENSQSEQDIFKLLSSFDYSEQQIRYAIWNAGDFGLIRTRSTSLDFQNNTVPKFEKTKKGSYIQKLVFKNISVLYLMGTGMKGLGIGASDCHNLINRRANQWLHFPDSKDRQFWVSVFKTGVHLLRHIKSADRRDRATSLGKSIEIDAKFTIPDLSTVVYTISSSAAGLMSTNDTQKSANTILLNRVLDFFQAQPESLRS